MRPQLLKHSACAIIIRASKSNQDKKPNRPVEPDPVAHPLRKFAHDLVGVVDAEVVEPSVDVEAQFVDHVLPRCPRFRLSLIQVFQFNAQINLGIEFRQRTFRVGQKLDKFPRGSSGLPFRDI